MREIQHEIVCSVRDGIKQPNLVISVNLRQTEFGPALSIIGMLGDSAGQIYKDIRRAECFNFRSGWTQEKLDKLLDVWEAYHLNDGGNTNEIFEIDKNSGKILNKIQTNFPNKDWEAITNDGENLYIGDFGNNLVMEM
jgi:hypothetical protein